jgi:hypothetical protein
MRKGIFVCFLILSLFGLHLIGLSGASAQGDVKFSSLEVDLWPEYDQPSLLVIYRAVLSDEVSLPAQLTFRIPTIAGGPTAVAVGPALDSVADVDSDVRVNGEWAEVSFLAAAPAVQLEYYDPSLAKTGDERHFTYTWPGDYAVDDLRIQVQQPVDAGEMNISPALEPGSQGQDGLTYHNKEIGSVAAGEPFTIQADYRKASDALTVRNLSVEPGAPAESTGGNFRSDMMAALPWILGLLGVILIVGGGVWYWQSGRSRERGPAHRRRKTASERESVPAEGYIYCHNCGKRAGPGDRFCRTCGTRLRIE